jgi:DNA-binding MarR family transcriptional regulator
MTEDSQQKLRDEQITAVVHGFTQVWNRFEVMLDKELVQIQERLNGIQPGKEPHTISSHELFYRVSNSIQQKDNLTMGELSNALSVPLSTATRIVDWLVDNGYAKRLPDQEDRRIVRVALTDIGREMHTIIDSYIRQRVQQILSCLTFEERATLLTLVGKVVSTLKEIAG